MPSVTDCQKLAFEELVAEVATRCTVEETRLIEEGSFSVAGPYFDSPSGWSLLSDEQLDRLISLGLIPEQAPDPDHVKVVKGAVECYWRLSDPSSFPAGRSVPEGLSARVGKFVYHAVVLRESGEVLGEWRLDVPDPVLESWEGT